MNGAIKYIEKQKEHHKTQTFKEEYLTMLKMAQIQYDEKYLWDWSLYISLSGLNYLFTLPRPHGLGYEMLAFQAIYKVTYALSINLIFTAY